MIYTGEEQEESVRADEEHAVSDHGRVGREETHSSRGKDHQQHGNRAGDAETQPDCRDGAAIAAALVARAAVLADEGGGGHSHALHGQHDELIQLVVAAPPRHHVRAEHVDIALHEDIGEGGDDRLDRGGHTHSKDPSQNWEIQMQLPPVQTIDITGAGQKHEDHRRRDKLGQDGGDGRARNPGLQHQHEEQVEHDVQHAREHQKV